MKLTPTKLVDLARKKAASVDAWADLANELFDPESGLIAKVFPNLEDRRLFSKTAEYQELWRIIEETQNRTGLIDGSAPKKSGRFVVRLPRSLHAALEAEAAREGVSLNQWVVTKLAIQVGSLMAKAAS